LFTVVVEATQLNNYPSFFFQHVRRKTHNIEGIVTFKDSGLWILPFDYTNNKHFVEAIPRLKTAGHVGCSQGPYCGLPFLMPVIKLFHPK